MRTTSLIMAAAILSSCTEMTHYYPDANLVAIDGIEHFVRDRGHRGFHAGPNKPGSEYSVWQHSGATYSAGNIAAIERFTGCKVDHSTVQHQDMHTFASVVC